MYRSLFARLIIAVFVILVGLSLTFALDDSNSQASTALPDNENLVVGQAQSFYYAHDAEQNALYLSEDLRAWRAVPLSVDGTIRAVAAPSLASGSFYIATDQGLYASSDQGQQWQSVAAPLGSVTVLAADPAEPTAAYAVTEQGALYRLSDSGQHATLLSGDELPASVRDVVSVGATPALLAATDQGLFRSEGASASWVRVETMPAASDLLVASDNPSVLFAATRESGLFRSMDAGATWESANEGLGLLPGSSLAITALAQDPARPGTLYVATAYVMGHSERHTTPAALLMSPDGGTQWIPVAEFALSDPLVSGILPPEGEGSGIRALTSEGIRPYRLDADQGMEMLGSDNPETRLKGAKILSVAAVPTQAQALLPYLQNEQEGELAYYVARALGHIGGEPVVSEMLSLLEQESSSIVKLRALMVLEMAADPSTVPALASAFQQDALSRGAADALAAIGTPEAWAPLTSALADAELDSAASGCDGSLRGKQRGGGHAAGRGAERPERHRARQRRAGPGLDGPARGDLPAACPAGRSRAHRPQQCSLRAGGAS